MVYGGRMERRKTIVLSTIAAAFCAFGGVVAYHALHQPAPLELNTASFPRVGKRSAPIEIVLIEDFRCRNCLKFSQNIVPKIYAEYIRQGKARFTLVPVSFLSGSQAVANALLEVHQQNPVKFFAYFHAILKYGGEDLKTADLLRIARRLEGIDLEKLEHCIESGCHNPELEKNLDWAREVMGVKFRTPALYINGAPGSTYSFEAIQYQINQILSPV